MPVVKRDDLRSQLKRRELSPVYVLFGPETNLRDLAARTIADFAFAPDDFRDMNEASFSLAADGNLQLALAAANQLPMMATRRVIRLTELRVSATGHRDTVTEAHEAALTAYLDQPSPHAIIIFIADELNGVRKMGRFLREKTMAVEFTTLSDADLTSLARARAAENGVSIDETALRLLLSRIGPDVHRLNNEINKLTAASMPSGRVTDGLVESLVMDTRAITPFALTDSLLGGDHRRALTTLRKILDEGAEPVALIGMLASSYRRMLLVKEMMGRNADRRDVERIMWDRNALAAARRTDTTALARALTRIARADLEIKTSVGGSGPTGSRAQIEMLVCDLAALSR